jgi:hypothetical protein
LRLMTALPYSMNMSNSTEISSDAMKAIIEKKASFGERLANLPIVRSPLMRIYNAIFKLYYGR